MTTVALRKSNPERLHTGVRASHRGGPGSSEVLVHLPNPLFWKEAWDTVRSAFPRRVPNPQGSTEFISAWHSLLWVQPHGLDRDRAWFSQSSVTPFPPRLGGN